MSDQEIDALLKSNDRIEALAAAISRRMGPHTCAYFTPEEAAAIKSVIRWGRIAFGVVIVSAVPWLIRGFVALVEMGS